jgi:antitoxin component of MazEF toxin-antitoxin module
MRWNEYFIGKVLQIGNSVGIVIPKRNMEYSGLKIGDSIKIYYKKIKK